MAACSLGVPEDPYDLPFNSVSSKTMRRLVDLVRDRYAGRNRPDHRIHSPDVPPLGELSFYFDRMLASRSDRAARRCSSLPRSPT